MNDQAAYLFAQAVTAMVRAQGMTAENMQREATGGAMAYTAGDFEAVIQDARIEGNDALLTLKGE